VCDELQECHLRQISKLVAKGYNDSEIRYVVAKVREKSSLALFETHVLAVVIDL